MCCQDEKLNGIVVEEECDAGFYDGIMHRGCSKCHGTGTITRPAEWGDILELAVFMLTMTANDTKRFSLDDKGQITFLLKSGGRLKLK